MRRESSKTLSGGAKLASFPASSDGDIKLVRVEMTNNRYPERGSAVNKDRTEAIYIVNGEFDLVYEGKSYKLIKDEVFYFEKDKTYSINGEGTIIVAVTPANFGEIIISI